jgi:hypothetical protein
MSGMRRYEYAMTSPPVAYVAAVSQAVRSGGSVNERESAAVAVRNCRPRRLNAPP